MEEERIRIGVRDVDHGGRARAQRLDARAEIDAEIECILCSEMGYDQAGMLTGDFLELVVR